MLTTDERLNDLEKFTNILDRQIHSQSEAVARLCVSITILEKNNEDIRKLIADLSARLDGTS